MLVRHTETKRVLGAVALGWIVCVSGPAIASAADMRVKLYGSIVGFVSGPSGVEQMGASVHLMDRYGHLIQRALTNERGAFGFDSLIPDQYSIRVFQTSFAPAAKSGVRVTPGERSFLSIHLATLASSIQLMPSAPGAATLMTDDWKWVLRSSVATRPVLRFLPGTQPRVDEPKTERRPSSVFTDTHGVLALSAGEAGSARAASIADMGTAFALSTSIFGTNQVMFSGNIGYSPANGVPAAGFRTSYRRTADADAAANPEFRLTVQQVFLPMYSSDRFNRGSLAAVSSMSAGMADQVKITDFLWAEIGASIDSVTFGSRMSYLSPYALTTLGLGDLGVVEFGFSSGIPPADLYRSRRSLLPREGNMDLHQNVTSLALMPRITTRDGIARVQRSQNYEVSYRKVFGSRTISAGYFREGLSDAALTISSPDGVFPTADVLPDFNSRSGVFNIGDLSRSGVTVAASQSLGEIMTVAIILSRAGVLRTDQNTLASDDPQEIRSSIRRASQNAVSARMSGVLPKVGTAYAASYQWTDSSALTPGHLFLTNLSSPDVGMNISVRQRVPAPPFMSGRMEISAEMRNLLAQGYLPLTSSDGRRMLLIHTPRALRGGVAFFF